MQLLVRPLIVAAAGTLHRGWIFATPRAMVAFVATRPRSSQAAVSVLDVTNKSIRFRVFRDDEVGVWIATSDEDAISTAAANLDALYERLLVIVPDVLESRGQSTSGVTILFELPTDAVV